MIGLKIDEEKDLKLSFPEEYHARDFAGKDVTFKVKLHEIKEEVKPELNNEFVKSLSFVKAETVKELRDFIRDTIKQTKFGDIENKNKSMLIKSLLENNIFTKIPTPMLSDEIRKIKEQFHSTLKDQNLTFKKFLELTNQKEEAFEVNFVRSAEDIIKISLLIEEIKKLEKISVDKKVLDEKIKELIDAKYVEADDKEKIELIRNNIESIETEKLIMDLLFEINKSKTSKVNKKETTKTEKVNKKETIKTEKVQKKETTKTEKVEVVKEKTKKPTKKVETVKDTSVKKPVEEKKVSTKKNKK
jgi:trigger factor